MSVSITILDEVTKDNSTEWIQALHLGYPVIDRKHKLSIRSRYGEITLLELENAYLRGKVCKQYTFGSDISAVDLILEFGSLNALHGAVKNNQLESRVDTYELKANRVWPILDLDRIKPLKAKPKKWTIPHVIRALVNGQYENLRCDGKYTDDYAFDAAYDFQRGELDGLSFAKRIYEFPSGWKAYEYEGRVSIDCHHFDTNTFVPKI